MATNFFERQSQARRNTTWLVAMFLIALVGMVATTFGIAVLVVAQSKNWQEMQSIEPIAPTPFPWEIPLFVGGGTLLLIAGGTLFKVIELRSGGGALVAERLGGKRLYPDSQGYCERQLLNVVEEMAIASGTPTPPVYLLDEKGINAFAAGYSPSDAVLGITRGAVEQLSRDELQGVIAHEFSHLLNGDMRMSIRLIGILHGILLLGLVGNMILRSIVIRGGGRSNRDRNNNALVLLAIGAALMILGFLGSFAGGLIKAAVSRQREYLADASAVQFTRNPSGIAGALRQIGASITGSRVTSPNAKEASHLFFSQGVWEGFSGLLATHPPLNKRILAIDPDWDGTFPEASTAGTSASSGPVAGAAGFAGETGRASEASRGLAEPIAATPLTPPGHVDLHWMDRAVEQVGDPGEIHRQYAAMLLASLPDKILSVAREPYGARAVVYCLLLDSNDEVRHKQIAALRSAADPSVLQLASQLQEPLAQLAPQSRLPLIDLTLPALRSLSTSQYETFDRCVQALIAADNNIALFEWALGRILARHLEPQFRKQRRITIQYYGLAKLGNDCSMLLATIAHVGHDPEQAAAAFQTAQPLLPEVRLTMRDRDACSLGQLQDSLTRLATAAAKHRGRLVDACAEVICADGQVTLSEGELLRGIADLLDCPMPPIIAGQTVSPAAGFPQK